MNFIWQWPQFAYLTLVVISVLYGASRHGKMDRYPHNAPIHLILTAFVLVTLYYGGFFTETRP